MPDERNPELRDRRLPCAANRGFPREFSPRIESCEDVYCAVDYDMANLAMVKVDGGYVAIDAGSGTEIAGRIAQQWEDIASGPLMGLIYTHSHPDHIGGADAFALADAPIWGHRLFLDELGGTQLLPNAYFVRGAKQFGFALDESEVLSNGIGPPLRIGPGVRPPVRVPNHVFDDYAEFEIGGRTFILQSAPGETNDHLFVWLPGQRVLFVGDNLYKSFPNLYSIRGVPPRPVRQWIDSLDAMRRLQPRPESLILGHTATVTGANRIHRLLTDYRDAIAYIHDSVVRGINAGRTPDQLTREIRLPPHLAEHTYLREHYGTIAGSIRGIYGGYMGWFDGEVAHFDPREDEIASWLLEELGGRDELLTRVEQATESGDLRRAMWLSQILFAYSPNWTNAKRAKACVLEKLADRCDNPLVRNWQLSEAAILRRRSKLPEKPNVNGATIEELPIEATLRLLPSRLNPKTSARVNMAIGFDIVDTRQQYTLLVRRGVGELSPGLVESPQLIIRATERDLKRIFLMGDVPPTRREFWQGLEFDVSDRGILTPIQRLIRLARVGRLFLRP